MMSDPVQVFEHDHVKCSNLVRALGEHVEVSRRKPSRGLLASLIEQLCEELFTHFAREEEGLFPFIVHQLPETKGTVDRLITAHDGICRILSRLSVLTSHTAPDAGLTAFDELLGQFNALYAQHSSIELTLLRDVDERIDRGQRARLRRLIRGL